MLTSLPLRNRIGTRIRAMATDAPTKDPIVQYIVLRRDLWKSEGWPLGSVVAQACHASTAALWIYKDDPITLEYTQDLDNMTKASFQLSKYRD